MKKIFTLLSVILFAGTLSAQHYQIPFLNAGQNPGNLNVDAAQPSGSPLLGSGSTNWSAGQAIPFSFMFNGNSYNQVYIAPSGVVTFTMMSGAGPTDANVAIPSALIPDNSICLWGLNLSGGNDGVEVTTYGTAPNRQYWISWKSASWAGIGSTSWAYWSIVLEETSNAVYIVDERNLTSAGAGPELTAGIQYTSSNAISVLGSPLLTATNLATGGNDVGVSDNSYYAFFSGVQPDYDATMSDLNLPIYLQLPTSGVDIKAKISNLGTQTITDLELSYSIGGGATVVANVSGLSIASGASTTVTHPTAWVPTTDGNFNVEFWASKINGNNDGNTGNDKTNQSVITYSNSYPRVVLYEMFTSSTCAPCKPGNENFEQVVSGIADADYSSIKYQMSWPAPGDPYNTDDGNTRRVYYNVTGVPNLEIDGGWGGNSGSFTMTEHNAAIAVPAFVEIDAEYSVNDKTVKACATLKAMQDLGDATLQFAITEGKTVQNVGNNGETEFFDVVKKMMPDASGQVITITNGMNTVVCEEWEFQGNFRLPNNSSDKIDDSMEHSVEEFSDLHVVVWLEANKVVLNSTKATNGITSVNNVVSTQNTVSIYPNPAVDNATVSIQANDATVANVKVMDMVGKTVLEMNNVNVNSGSTTIELNTANFNAGVYMLVVTMDGNTSTKQLVIQK